MKKITAIIFLFLVYTNASFTQWSIVSSPSNSNLYGLYFVNSNTGFIGGNQGGPILRTTDGGNTFFITPTGSSSWWLDIFFIDNVTGFASGQNGVIIKTTNQGLNWAIVNPSASFMHSIRLPSANIGYSVGALEIRKTTNQGANWFSISHPFNGYLLSVHFLNELTGFACGEQGNIGKTTNGGSTWTLSSLGSGELFEEVVFTDNNTGYIAGKFGRILKSTDAGNNWLIQNSGTSEWLLDIFMINNNTGWACGMAGKILYTSNGGTNWITQTTPTSAWIRQIHFIDNLTGFAVTDNGLVLKTTNGGITGINLINSEIPNEFSLSQNYPNPFNPSTKIKFAIPGNSNVVLKLFDSQGKEIATLVNDNLQAGYYEYDYNGSNLSSGIYFYKIISGNFVETRKMVLVK